MAEWHPTGWRGKTVLQYTVLLPGDISGHIWRRSINAPWRFKTPAMDGPQGAYKHRAAAQKACEAQLRNELRTALKALRPLSARPSIRLL